MRGSVIGNPLSEKNRRKRTSKVPFTHTKRVRETRHIPTDAAVERRRRRRKMHRVSEKKNKRARKCI